MALTRLFSSFRPAFPSLADPLYLTLFLLLLFISTLIVRRLFSSPLCSVPGPILWRLSRLSGLYASYAGHEATLYTNMFRKYNTPILRIGPNEVLIADGNALSPIYHASGGMDKADCYNNFHIDGFPTLFSAVDRAHRLPRARSVKGLFATRSLREDEAKVENAVQLGVERLSRERKRALNDGGPVDLLSACRAVALDVVTSYLFGTSYGGVEEETNHLSAGAFVDAFVGVGRFFFLPPWLFGLVDRFCQWAFETRETVQSMDLVDSFVRGLVDDANVEDGTYQAQMLKLGLSKDEVVAQCKDLIFAGTDSSGMNLSTFCWNVTQQPAIYNRLKDELRRAREEDIDCDLSTLPYFRACIRETLRLSMANPTRLPRVVPEGGWTFQPTPDFSYSATKSSSKWNQKVYFLPAGTLVSVQIHTLHYSPAIFPDAGRFDPDRWLTASDQQLEKMNRDWIPFSVGSRQCIARNLAMVELNLACAAIIEAGVLSGAKPVGARIEILEWFNSRVRGERIEIEYSKE
ncbi:cytochrome P450 [Myriangium duriaei CBS 260.36]|uniref:Cytochrome P450 n=1 Tax=Myriangium duriaei CBS 260.36 TaxID=1168546 RepID=A0A9P4J8P0_9PEZI|nr:cytochrome P450 [Myriangium duriaei CBS 260.36]